MTDVRVIAAPFARANVGQHACGPGTTDVRVIAASFARRTSAGTPPGQPQPTFDVTFAPNVTRAAVRPTRPTFGVTIAPNVTRTTVRLLRPTLPPPPGPPSMPPLTFADVTGRARFVRAIRTAPATATRRHRPPPHRRAGRHRDRPGDPSDPARGSPPACRAGC
jgi:hypothetical protein